MSNFLGLKWVPCLFSLGERIQFGVQVLFSGPHGKVKGNLKKAFTCVSSWQVYDVLALYMAMFPFVLKYIQSGINKAGELKCLRTHDNGHVSNVLVS